MLDIFLKPKEDNKFSKFNEDHEEIFEKLVKIDEARAQIDDFFSSP